MRHLLGDDDHKGLARLYCAEKDFGLEIRTESFK